MTPPSVDVYLWFVEGVAAESERDFLAELTKSLPPDVELHDHEGKPQVHFASADPQAALIAVQMRAMPICEQLGLTDSVRWSLEPS